jgi:hypothetical protein
MIDQTSAFLTALAQETKAYVAEVTSPLLTKIADLEQRLASIPAGPKGEPGEKGDTGDRGPAGEMGAIGPAGPQGEAGLHGERGSDGVSGKDGFAGEPGINGKDGQDGISGKDGLNGKDGVDGINGKDGSDGLNGKDGAPGLNGKDFDPVEMHAAIVKAVGALPKPKDGESVHPDTVAVMVREAVDKYASTIRVPQDGAPGRDALDLDIVDEIEEGRSYAFGTFAKYRGGVVKAMRHTDPIEDGFDKSGWQIVVDGLDSFEVVQGDDLRTFTLRFAKTSGVIQSKSFDLPVVIDRGVFKQGETYKTGDAVTWGGSVHIAQCETTATPGTIEAGKDWRLAVKRGRDGKDGK